MEETLKKFIDIALFSLFGVGVIFLFSLGIYELILAIFAPSKWQNLDYLIGIISILLAPVLFHFFWNMRGKVWRGSTKKLWLLLLICSVVFVLIFAGYDQLILRAS